MKMMTLKSSLMERLLIIRQAYETKLSDRAINDDNAVTCLIKISLMNMKSR